MLLCRRLPWLLNSRACFERDPTDEEMWNSEHAHIRCSQIFERISLISSQAILFGLRIASSICLYKDVSSHCSKRDAATTLQGWEVANTWRLLGGGSCSITRVPMMVAVSFRLLRLGRDVVT